MSFLGGLIMLSAMVGGIYFVIRSNLAYRRTMGPQAQADGAAEYARRCRENPDGPESSISEAEFVSEYLKAQPSYLRFGLFAMGCLAVLNPIGCFMMASG